MRRSRPETPSAEAPAQRDADHQRWADDGGHIPDPAVARPEPPTPAASAAVRHELPVRPVYRRRVVA